MSTHSRHATLRRWTYHEGDGQLVRKLDLSACSTSEKRLLDYAYLGGGWGWSDFQEGSEPGADKLLCIVLNTNYKSPQSQQTYYAMFDDYDWDALRNAGLGITEIVELGGDNYAKFEVQIPIDNPADAERLLVPVLKKHIELVQAVRQRLRRS